MNSSESENKMVLGENKVVHYALQLLALSLLLIMCFRIIEPFLTLLIWGSVLAIALYPVYKGLSKKLKGRNALKPILLGQGAPAPMVVVFMGAIGGFITSGFIGLFTGAIILTLGYKLTMGWLKQSNDPQPETTT